MDGGGQISPSPIDFHRRPYNTLALLCERVMLLERDRGSKTTPRPKFSVISVGVILNQRGLNPFNPPGRANSEHVNTAKPVMRVHCVAPHASSTIYLMDRASRASPVDPGILACRGPRLTPLTAKQSRCCSKISGKPLIALS